MYVNMSVCECVSMCHCMWECVIAHMCVSACVCVWYHWEGARRVERHVTEMESWYQVYAKFRRYILKWNDLSTSVKKVIPLLSTLSKNCIQFYNPIVKNYLDLTRSYAGFVWFLVNYVTPLSSLSFPFSFWCGWRISLVGFFFFFKEKVFG